ncbi:NAD(P)H-binding protein [Kitasatospora sp. NA04385]|uniref:SDR family oxidoreductase n=1 Tax=Kitasatospora sp. NA04385 TaxID=2742135 RepID=UPI0015913137|nr:NAD(P)H-binding protein [Kitasatospora sp. NA04385]QKW20258.1 NAD(P)H-binding protein [Kitasatospora sp. NA04385]
MNDRTAPPLLVTGATGVLGREVLRSARATGRPVRALTRRTGLPADADTHWHTGDLTAGTGLDAAFAGADAVIHCASDPRHPENDLPAFRHLLDAARRAGVRHVVNVSIVGVDLIPLKYYRIKLRGEQLLGASGLGWTNLRATQFPQLLDGMLGPLARLPLVPMVSRTPVQPVHPAEVAARLVELALGEPAGHAPDFAGPETRLATDLAADWLRSTGRRRPVLPLHLPGRAGRALRAGALTAPQNAYGTRTWAEFLAGK